jgi:hypothetical protein
MIVNIISYKRNKKTTGREIKKMMKLKKKREWIILWNVNGHGLEYKSWGGGGRLSFIWLLFHNKKTNNLFYLWYVLSLYLS